MNNTNNSNLLVKQQRLTKAERSLFTLSSDLKEILIGLILGDLFIEKQKACINVRLVFKQGVVHTEYLQHLYELFGDFCGMVPKIPAQSPDKRTGKIYESIRFYTFSLPCFLEFYNLFYKASGGKKNVLFLKDMNYVDMFFTPFTLAIWICDDGCWTNYGVRISCNAFTLKEVELLVHILNYKFNLECTIQKIYIENQYSIYIKSNSIHTLREIVLPHMPKSMLYKLGLN